jgi:hypothetical protein
MTQQALEPWQQCRDLGFDVRIENKFGDSDFHEQNVVYHQAPSDTLVVELCNKLTRSTAAPMHAADD